MARRCSQSNSAVDVSRKITFRHPQAQAFVYGPADLQPALRLATWYALESALGRPLIDAERDEVSRAIGSARFSKARASDAPSTEDVRVTLAALARIADSEAVAEFANAGARVRAYMGVELAADRYVDRVDPSAASIKQAAAAALAAVTPVRRGPGHRWPRLLAERARELWRQFGGAEYSASVNPGTGYATPLVRFTQALFDEVPYPIAESGVARLLNQHGTNSA